MKKYLFLTLLLFAFLSNSFAQSPEWIWAKSAGGTSYAEGNSITSDAIGNIYVTGHFEGSTIIFGNDTLEGWARDIFVVKYDSLGSVLWAKRIGGDSSNCWSTNISVDSYGNIYIAGWFNAAPIIIGTDTLINNGGLDVFIAKLDNAGNVLWAKSAGQSDNDWCSSIDVDTDGNLLVTGYFYSDSITFGGITLQNNFYAVHYSDIFIVKYDSFGNVIWAKRAGGEYHDYSSSIIVNADGSLLITGYFYSDTLTFGGTTLTNNSNGTETAFFIVKYDNNGNVKWAKSTGNTGVLGTGVDVDVNGNIYVTGQYTCNTVSFGGTILSNISYNTYPDAFLVKYDSIGNVQWAKSINGSWDEHPYSISTDADGNSYLTGSFNSETTSFAPLTLTNYSTERNDIFVAKYNNSGNVLWVKSAGGYVQEDDIGMGICIDNNGNAYITGWFQTDTIFFGSDTLYTPFGAEAFFIAKLKYIPCSAQFTLTPDTIPHHYYITNNASGVPPLTFVWSWGDGTYDYTAYPSHTYSAAGYYNICLTITDSTGCTSTHCDSSYLSKNSDAMVYVNVIPQTGIAESTINKSLLIYPNPASDIITIETSQKSDIEILNIQGQVIKRITARENATTIDVSAFARGMYFVKVKTENGVAVKKFIKE